MLINLSGPPKVYTIAIQQEGPNYYGIFMGSDRVNELGRISACERRHTALELAHELEKAVAQYDTPVCIVWVRPKRRPSYPEL